MVRYCNLLLISLILLMSCKKDEDTFPKNQNSFGTFLFLNKDVKIEKLNSAGTHLMGYQFGAAARGKIHQIGIFSAELGVYEVTILDSATNNVIFRDTIRQTSLENWTFRDIYPQTIESSQKYIIYTKNLPLKAFNAITQKNSPKLHYPLKINDITIDHALFALSQNNALTKDTTFMYGIVDFTFRQDR